MDGQVVTTQEIAVDTKPTNTGSWRINQAIDLLLDYLMKQEDPSQAVIRNADESIELAF